MSVVVVVKVRVPARVAVRCKMAVPVLVRENILEVKLSPEAKADFDRLQDLVEGELGPGGEFAEKGDWAGKVCGAIGRIALGLHLLEHWGLRGNSADSADVLSRATMRASLSWFPYLVEQEAIVSRGMGLDETALRAEKILGWLDRSGRTEFTRREAFNGCQSVLILKVTDIDPALDLLQELHQIRELPGPERHGAGRKPSPMYAVNPNRRRREAAR